MFMFGTICFCDEKCEYKKKINVVKWKKRHKERNLYIVTRNESS